MLENDDSGHYITMEVMSGETSNIRVATNSGGAYFTAYIHTYGYLDPRGKN